MNMTVLDMDMLQDRAFIAAFEQLLNQVKVERSCSLLQEMQAHLRALTEGRPTSHSLAAGVLAALAILHVTMGTPLHLTDELLDAWERSVGTAAECRRCHYRMPVGYRTCVLCGGIIGQGGISTRNLPSTMN